MPKRKTTGQPAAKVAEPAKVRARRIPSKPAKATLSIDYPLEGEIVTSSAYTIRLTAHEPRAVEVSLDGVEWRPTRESVGHWWYDWTGYQSGAYTLSARMTGKTGRKSTISVRQFTVLI